MLTMSVGNNDFSIIKSILKLHVPQGFIDLDPTYSKGNFYKHLPKPTLKYDISPQTSDTLQSCVTELPIKPDSLKCIIFDPPFLATSGPSLKKVSGNLIAKRFGVFQNEKVLHLFYLEALKKLYTLLKQNGILIFKCQDKVSSGKNYFSHVIIMQQALNIGFYPKDLFILLASSRVVANWQRNQQHARKFHSYYWVFEKRNSKIDYNGLILNKEQQT